MRKKVYLVGSTGFVGNNLVENGCFDMMAHSTDVKNMYYHEPDILIYAGVTGTKWLANQNPDRDQENIESAKKNINLIKPKKLVLISTVDVYDNLNKTNEQSVICENNLHTYGQHRYRLEKWVESNCSDYHIVRIPALYGKDLRKNFVYDLINLIPMMLKDEDLKKIELRIANITKFYEKNNDGLNVLKAGIEPMRLADLRMKFVDITENALQFTNSNSTYQFYNLKWLWKDIQDTINNKIKVRNIVTEPIKAGDLYQCVVGRQWINNVPAEINYNIQTIYGKESKYTKSKETVLDDLKKYCIKEIKKKYEKSEL